MTFAGVTLEMTTEAPVARDQVGNPFSQSAVPAMRCTKQGRRGANGRPTRSRHNRQRSVQKLSKRKQDVADDQTTKGYIPEAMTHTFSIQRRAPPSCLANAACKPWKHTQTHSNPNAALKDGCSKYSAGRSDSN
jgi:hypothetical protein